MFGPPGSGKGTQGARLAARLRIPHISTGDILREARAAGTELGRRAADFMDRGNLVPDAVMVAVVADRLGKPDCAGGFVLDGFPRTVAQAESLRQALDAARLALQHVVSLQVPEDEIVRRLTGRLTCRSCGRPWPESGEQAALGRCTCGGALGSREDDRPDAVKRRLEVYASQTEPLIEWYRRHCLLREVDGTGDADAVFARLNHELSGAAA